MSQNEDLISLEMGRTRNRRGSASSRNKRDLELAESDAEPLQPPKAVPELDDDDDADEDVPHPTPGVDDGFFPTNPQPRKPSDNPTKPGVGNEKPNGSVPHKPTHPRIFPYAPDFGPNGPNGPNDPNVPTYPNVPIFVDINGVPTLVPDVNMYQQKKTLAQGMMDIALLSANANQLRYVLESYRRHPYYISSLIFISISLIFQIAVGFGLIFNSKYNVNDQREICKANRINNFTVIGIFIVTTVNVFIAAFGVANPPADMNG